MSSTSRKWCGSTASTSSIGRFGSTSASCCAHFQLCSTAMAPTDLLEGPKKRQDRPRVNILGVGVDAVDMEKAVESIIATIVRGTGGYVCVTGVHGVMEAQRDSGLRQIL